MKIKIFSSVVPLIFTITGYLLGGSFVVYLFYKLNTFEEKVMFLVMVSTYILWSAWEVRITLSELKKEDEKKDKSTLELAGIIKNFMLVGALAASSSIHAVSWCVGYGLICLGIILRAASIKAIGSAYSHRIRELVGKPITTGPYKIIRHPSYMGTLIIHTGLVVVLFNTFSLIGLILWYLNAIYRIRVEEKQLFKNKYYAGYAKSTVYRLIPVIW